MAKKKQNEDKAHYFFHALLFHAALDFDTPGHEIQFKIPNIRIHKHLISSKLELIIDGG